MAPDANYDKGWTVGVSAWLMDPCTKPDESDEEAFQRIREACWEAYKDAPGSFWDGFTQGIREEFSVNV